MNSVEKIRTILKERKIPFSRVERDLGFANGYIARIKEGALPNGRLKAIADYLDIRISDLMDEDTELPKSPFEALMNSLGYTIVRDDPEHSGFIKYKGDMIALRYGDLDDLKQSILVEINEKVDALATKRRLALYAKQIQELNAAHKIEGSSKEDIAHDENIMGDDRF